MTTARSHGVEAVLTASSIAIVGASNDPTRIGGRPVRYLLDAGFKGEIYPINPTRDEVQGLRTYPSIDALPVVPDVVMIALPASGVPATLRACAQHGVTAVIIASAGFSESGDDGTRLQQEVTDIAGEAGIAVLGPNCLGVFNSATNFYPTFATALSRGFPADGPIGIASQSGAYGAHAAFLARRRRLGVGAMVTTGNESDIDVADVIHYYADRPDISVVLAYAEGVRHGGRLIAAFKRARETNTKIVFLKVGSSRAGSRAASSHTAALAGADEVFDGVCAQYGVYRATSTEEQLDVVYALARGLVVAGNRMGIVTVSGGAGVHLCDAAERFGMEVPQLNATSQATVSRLLPYASATNPVDVTAQALQKVDLLTEALREVVTAEDFDVAIAYFTTTLLASAFARVLADAIIDGTVDRGSVPVVLVMVADDEVVHDFEDRGFLVFEDTERAVRAVAAVHRLTRVADSDEDADVSRPGVLPAGPYNEYEASTLLRGAGIPMVDQRLARSAADAVTAAQELGHPVVMKVCSSDIVHKTDIGGVILGVDTSYGVRAAYEEILHHASAAFPDARIDGVLVAPMVASGVELVAGLVNDPAFGPVVMVGLGGIHVEVLRDTAFRAAPVSPAEARRMIDGLKGRLLLDARRGSAASDVPAVARAVAALSEFGSAHADEITSAEINPLVALEEGVVGLDAVVIRS